MNRRSLHDEFVIALNKKIPKKSDLVNEIADLLRIEKDSAYRRLSGKVNFSLHEAGIIADGLGLSIDGLMRPNDDFVWMPFVLEHPMAIRSMDSCFDMIELSLDHIRSIVEDDLGEMGSLFNVLPMEFYLYSPELTKYMFFRWGHYFIGTEEYNDYTSWELPVRAGVLFDKLKMACHYDPSFYIWDDTLIWTVCKEISNLHRMGVLTDTDVGGIKSCLKDMLGKLEQTLGGNLNPDILLSPTADVYVAPVQLGFTTNYFRSENKHSISYFSNFTFCNIVNNPDSFFRLKNWVDSFRNISTLLSKSGRVERKLFFNDQNKTIEQML